MSASLFFSVAYILISASHASIDPKIRAERGLPEDIIRLCVGIEDAGDLLDDLEHSLLEAGAIVPASTGPERYVRVHPGVKQGDSISRAVERLSEGIRPKEHREWFVSAPGKVILFGEHAVVHGVVSAFVTQQFWCSDVLTQQTALAASVDLRCYALTTPRHDGKVSVHFIDVGDFRHEWSLEELPWEAVTPVDIGEIPADQLDQKLVDALLNKPIPESMEGKARTAALAFLYLYMVLTHGGER